MFWKKKNPFAKLQLGVDVKRCAECGKHERPCLADGKPAVFHRWADGDNALLRINSFITSAEGDVISRRFRETGVVPNYCSTELVRAVFALVEYPDGSVGQVKPELIQFLDRGDDCMG